MTREIIERFKHDDGGWAGGYYVAHGGNRGGYLAYSDSGGDDGEFSTFDTPKFLGDKSAYFRGTLSYDIFASQVDTVPFGSVAIRSDEGEYIFKDVGAPGSDWTHISIELDASAHWHFGTPNGPLATNAQIKAILAQVDEIAIHTAFSTGPEQDGLDNVAFKPAGAASAPLDGAIETGGLPHGHLEPIHITPLAAHLAIA